MLRRFTGHHSLKPSKLRNSYFNISVKAMRCAAKEESARGMGVRWSNLPFLGTLR